ncbi:hypothetical protein AVEN_197829-1 [Araneus ventricosus]|uniref:Uncharacterized protein n=1 Tax=Araneus ventricosus TaxID=182803 RepID=A0A4Y2WKN3_ARAVE|nr:hypothetical protein AVEN_197829-1 [Araneus ventricosus]
MLFLYQKKLLPIASSVRKRVECLFQEQADYQWYSDLFETHSRMGDWFGLVEFTGAQKPFLIMLRQTYGLGDPNADHVYDRNVLLLTLSDREGEAISKGPFLNAVDSRL